MAYVGAAAAVAALAYGVYSGERGATAQRQAVHRQEKAQRESAAAAAAQRRRAEMEAKKANAKKPDVAGLLASENARALQGPNATMLTGTSGATRGGSVKLGQTSMLGA